MHIAQGRYAPGLRSRLVLRHHAPGREIQRILVVRFFGCGAVGNGVKAGAAVGGGELVQEQARRTRMRRSGTWRNAGEFVSVRIGTGPEHAVFRSMRS